MTSNREYNQIDAFMRGRRLLEDIRISDTEEILKEIGRYLDETEHLVD